MNVLTKIYFKNVLDDFENRSFIFTATFFLSKKSSQKSQDGGNLSTHKAGAGPVSRKLSGSFLPALNKRSSGLIGRQRMENATYSQAEMCRIFKTHAMI
jgi:hypothetical protein